MNCRILRRFLPVDTELVAIPSDLDREIEEVNVHPPTLHSEDNGGRKLLNKLRKLAARGRGPFHRYSTLSMYLCQ